MRKPRPEDYDPEYYKKQKGPKPEDIDLDGIVPLKPRNKSAKTTNSNIAPSTRPRTDNSLKDSPLFKAQTDDKDAASKDAGTSPPENLQACKLASLQANKHAYMQTSLHAFLRQKATYTVTFRYPPELIDKLEDMLHQAKKQHKTKLTKNSVAVAALIFLLADFESYGTESVLYQMLIKAEDE